MPRQARQASGTKRDRVELIRMMDALREGDVVIITELSRLSRSVKDLFEIVDRIHNIGADIKSIKESWIDTTTPQGKLLFTIFAGISQFERDLIRQRTIIKIIPLIACPSNRLCRPVGVVYTSNRKIVVKVRDKRNICFISFIV